MIIRTFQTSSYPTEGETIRLLETDNLTGLDFAGFDEELERCGRRPEHPVKGFCDGRLPEVRNWRWSGVARPMALR
jgi:hypothetical protein